MANVKLSGKEQIFCNEYIKTNGDGKTAIKLAGYASTNESSMSVQCSRLLKTERIIKELERQNNFNLRANAISKNQIIQEQYELYQLARADERYKDASTILSELTKVLGYSPTTTTKEINHNVRFEKLLANAMPAIAMDDKPKIIN